MVRIGTLALGVYSLGFLPSHQTTDSRSSTSKPETASRHLHAGHHSPSKQVPDELILRM